MPFYSRDLPARTLSEILAPNGLMVNRPFELNVDQWKFVGHPFSVQHGMFSIKFNIVFVVEVRFYLSENCLTTGYLFLQSHSGPSIVKAYDRLSHLMGSALIHEERK